MNLSISSAVFADGGPIPQRCTCDGADLSPPLQWTGVPSNAQSLALIVEDALPRMLPSCKPVGGILVTAP